MKSTQEQVAARQRLDGLRRLTDSTPATCPDCGLTLPRGRTIEGRCPDCWLLYKLQKEAAEPPRNSRRDQDVCRCCGRRKSIRARGMCRACYRKWRRLGAPLDAWGDADIRVVKQEILG
jgi:ribosomal protein S14